MKDLQIYSLGKICSLRENTKFEAFLFWNSDSSFTCKQRFYKCGFGRQNREFKNNHITFSFQSGFALYLSLLLFIFLDQQVNLSRSGAARQRDSYQRQAKGSDPGRTRPIPCSGLRNPVDAHFAASERREKRPGAPLGCPGTSGGNAETNCPKQTRPGGLRMANEECKQSTPERRLGKEPVWEGSQPRFHGKI